MPVAAETAAFFIVPDRVNIRVLPKLIDKIPYNTYNGIFCCKFVSTTHSKGLGLSNGWQIDLLHKKRLKKKAPG